VYSKIKIKKLKIEGKGKNKRWGRIIAQLNSPVNSIWKPGLRPQTPGFHVDPPNKVLRGLFLPM
jgi:hypothetical protein